MPNNELAAVSTQSSISSFLKQVFGRITRVLTKFWSQIDAFVIPCISFPFGSYTSPSPEKSKSATMVFPFHSFFRFPVNRNHALSHSFPHDLSFVIDLYFLSNLFANGTGSLDQLYSA